MTFNYYTQFPQNWQSLTMNISRSTAIQHVCCVPQTPFLQLVWHPFSCIWLISPSSVTKRTSDCQRLRSLDDTVLIAKLSWVMNWPDWGPHYSVESFSCFHELQCTGNGTHAQWIVVLSIVSFHCTCAKNI